MLLLWLIVSGSAASTVKNDITNQMTDAVESRASIINDYVTSAEEYVTAFALGREVHDLLADPDNPEILEEVQRYTEEFASVKGIFEGVVYRHSGNACADPYFSGCSWYDHPKGRIPGGISENYFSPAPADESGDYEISGDRKHDPVHVLSYF